MGEARLDKLKILVISVVFLVMISFVVIAQGDVAVDTRQATEDYIRDKYDMSLDEFLLEKLGLGVTIDGVKISVVGNKIVVTVNKGNAELSSKTEDVSVVLNGGTLFVAPFGHEPYTGTINIQDGGVIHGAYDKFIFGSGGTVEVVNGVIQFQNVDLKRGTEFSHPDMGGAGHISIHGKDVSYNSETGEITSTNLQIFDIEINSEFDDLSFVYDIATNKVTVVDDGWVSIVHKSIVDNEIVNKEMILLDGAVGFGYAEYHLNSLTLDGGSVLTMVIKNEEEERTESSSITFDVSRDTCIGVAAGRPGCVNDGNSIILMESESSPYPYPFTSDLFIDTAGIYKIDDDGNKVVDDDGNLVEEYNKISIDFWNVGPGPDDTNNIFVNEIEGGSKVNIEVATFDRLADGRAESTASSVVRFVFSEDSVISQNDPSGMRTNIMYVYGEEEGESVPWMIYNGKEWTGDEVGATARDVVGDFYDFNGRLSDYLDLMPPPPEFRDIIGDVDVSEVVKEFANSALKTGVISTHFDKDVYHSGVELNIKTMELPTGAVVEVSFTDENKDGKYTQGEQVVIRAKYITGNDRGEAIYREDVVRVGDDQIRDVYAYSTETRVGRKADGSWVLMGGLFGGVTKGHKPNIVTERVVGMLGNRDVTRPLTQEELIDMNMGATIIRNPTSMSGSE